MSAKLIFSDIDGTLITSQGVVSSTTIEAIRKQIIAGNLFIPVSARFPKGIMNVVDKITNFATCIDPTDQEVREKHWGAAFL